MRMGGRWEAAPVATSPPRASASPGPESPALGTLASPPGGEPAVLRPGAPARRRCWAGGDAGSTAMADRRAARGRPGTRGRGGASREPARPRPAPASHRRLPAAWGDYVRGYSRPFTSDPAPGCGADRPAERQTAGPQGPATANGREARGGAT